MSNPITLNIDADALREAAGTDRVVEMLERVEAVLNRIETKLTDDGRVLWSRAETAKAMGICERSLDTIEDLPAVKIGTRTMYQPARVRQWCGEHERTMEAVG